MKTNKNFKQSWGPLGYLHGISGQFVVYRLGFESVFLVPQIAELCPMPTSRVQFGSLRYYV
jgi:hypothetical protein